MTIAVLVYGVLGIAIAALVWRLVRHTPHKSTGGIVLLSLAAIAVLWPLFLALAAARCRNPTA